VCAVRDRARDAAGRARGHPRLPPPVRDGAVVPSWWTWRLLEALRDGDWDAAEQSPPDARRDAAGLVAAHLQWHLERRLRSLPLVERRGVPRVDLEHGVPDSSEGAPRSEEPTEGAPRSERSTPDDAGVAP
jgi:DNA repair protein RecO (recombination protein O)